MSERICTWVGCTATATTIMYNRNNQPWADLCPAHHKELEDEIASDLKAENKAKNLLRIWVQASGGPEKMAKSMSTAMNPAIARMLERLTKGT